MQQRLVSIRGARSCSTASPGIGDYEMGPLTIDRHARHALPSPGGDGRLVDTLHLRGGVSGSPRRFGTRPSAWRSSTAPRSASRWGSRTSSGRSAMDAGASYVFQPPREITSSEIRQINPTNPDQTEIIGNGRYSGGYWVGGGGCYRCCSIDRSPYVPLLVLTACTTFLVQDGDQLAVGKSYDWNMGQGLVLTNKKGVKKKALLFDPRERAAEWTSLHASLTFNQYGRELPNGGINDAGLVIEIMWLEGSVYPPKDQRPAINELQWIQYQLDTYATVGELVAHAPELRVSPASGRVHYLACDANAACASFEYVDGALVVNEGAKALTNHTYAASKQYLEAQSDDPEVDLLARPLRSRKPTCTTIVRRRRRWTAPFRSSTVSASTTTASGTSSTSRRRSGSTSAPIAPPRSRPSRSTPSRLLARPRSR